jgi:hypothetical protein
MRNTLPGFCWLGVGVIVTSSSRRHLAAVVLQSVSNRDSQFLPIIIDTPVIC